MANSLQINANGIDKVDFIEVSENVPLTGTDTAPLNALLGGTVTDGDIIVLGAQTDVNTWGYYRLAITGANYTLTLIDGRSLAPTSLFNKTCDRVIIATLGTNAGKWEWSTNGVTATFTKSNTVSDKEFTVVVPTFAVGANTVVFTFTPAFVNTPKIVSILPAVASYPTGVAQSPAPTVLSNSGATFIINNLGAEPITNITFVLTVNGI